MAGIARKQACEAIKIGGFADHVHVLLVLPPVIPLAKAIQFLRGSSSKWINDIETAGLSCFVPPGHSTVADRGFRCRGIRDHGNRFSVLAGSSPALRFRASCDQRILDR